VQAVEPGQESGAQKALRGKDTIRDQAVFVAETWYTYYL
jgi:hypothetical protein